MCTVFFRSSYSTDPDSSKRPAADDAKQAKSTGANDSDNTKKILLGVGGALSLAATIYAVRVFILLTFNYFHH